MENKTRPVSDEQLSILTFFKKPIPESMTHDEAENLIISVLTNPKHQQRWDDSQENDVPKVPFREILSRVGFHEFS